jgi:hypothetical protein
MGQYLVMVDKWMCSNTCKCYSGPDSSNQLLWESYGNQVLNAYYRTSDSKNGVYQGKSVYRFEWSDDPKEAIHTFKQCYETIIKPQTDFYSKQGYA